MLAEINQIKPAVPTLEQVAVAAPQQVRTRCAGRQIRLQYPAQRTYILVNHIQCTDWGSVVPDQIDQLGSTDRLVRPGQEHRQENSLLSRTRIQLDFPSPQSQRTQDLKTQGTVADLRFRSSIGQHDHAQPLPMLGKFGLQSLPPVMVGRLRQSTENGDDGLADTSGRCRILPRDQAPVHHYVGRNSGAALYLAPRSSSRLCNRKGITFPRPMESSSSLLKAATCLPATRYDPSDRAVFTSPATPWPTAPTTPPAS